MTQEADPAFMEALMRSMEEDARKDQEKRFAAWCRDLEALPADFELKPKDGFKADLELQPFRWMSLGLDLLKSSKGTIAVQGFHGPTGEFLDTYLEYPVFQMGAEIFLKGMWLCQFPDCRALADHGYMEEPARLAYQKRLKDLGHDLLKLIAANRQIAQYPADADIMRFLKIVEGIVRQYYFPLYQADKRGNHWAHSRYPKRFYKDAAKEGRADAFHSYPQQWAIVKLFEPMEHHIDQLWQLRAGLRAQFKAHNGGAPS
jgi:hypothetical protein